MHSCLGMGIAKVTKQSSRKTKRSCLAGIKDTLKDADDNEEKKIKETLNTVRTLISNACSLSTSSPL